MEEPFKTLVEDCKRALGTPDPQASVQDVISKAVENSSIAEAVSWRTEFKDLEDMAVHVSDELTVLAATMPPGFAAAPHNHNLWSVVGVCAGQEDNTFFERDGSGLRQTAQKSVIGPGVLANGADVIHAIRNPLDTPLLALHAYGGNLFATPRSNWNPETHEEVAFDWTKVARS